MIFFPKQYKIVNFSGNYENGIWKEYRTAEINISADVQPMTGKEVETLDIGRRELGKVKIYTDETLTVVKEADESSSNNGTYIYFLNNWYEVINEIGNRGNLINHNKYIAELRKNDEVLKIPCM